MDLQQLWTNYTPAIIGCAAGASFFIGIWQHNILFIVPVSWLSAISIGLSLIMMAVNAIAHERTMARLYAERQQHDKEHEERMIEIYGNRSAR